MLPENSVPEHRLDGHNHIIEILVIIIDRILILEQNTLNNISTIK